ncbi:hypothetical protein C5S32_02400 [ANME-1 cluster archaeon GoMg1]|nr:hypothetical protein [ANME-1 cluster archaeon GoMg1]
MGETIGEEQRVEQSVLAQESWVLALEGVVALIVGFIIFIFPIEVVVLTIFVGAFAFVWGICALVASVKAEKGRRWLRIIEGVCGIIFGLLLLIWPVISTVVTLWFIMVWLVVIGLVRIAGAFALPKGEPGKWLLGFDGVLALIIGMLLLSLPFFEGLLTMAILIGLFGIIAGISLISLAFVAKSAQGQIAA